jgi:hypothetical protein
MIVLVVIGLLLGGILKGQGLVNNARTKKIVHNASSLYTAVQMFGERYQALPGDFRQAGGYLNGINALVNTTDLTMAFNGDGDGVIDLDTEAALAMHHLSAASMFVCPVCIGLRGEMIGAGNSPVNVFGGYMAIYTGTHQFMGGRDFLETVASASDRVGAWRAIANTGSRLPVGIIAEVDLKIDNGLPHTGMFREASRDPVLGRADPCSAGAGYDPVNRRIIGTGPGTTEVSWDVEGELADCAGAMIL